MTKEVREFPIYDIFIANNAKALEALNPTHTVEAEYGDVVVEGSEVTLAHHGVRSSNPCPCIGRNISQSGYDQKIGVSHFDLDTLGGVMRCVGSKPVNEDLFWEVAALVDTMGIHKLDVIQHNITDPTWQGVLEQLHAFWAWSESHRLFPPRDGSVKEVTYHFDKAILALHDIFMNDKKLLAKGKEWADKKAQLEIDSYYGTRLGTVVLRSSEQFTNHLYSHRNELLKACVSFNTKTKAVTISLADPIKGVSCCELAQHLWGKDAGGHAGIAGSPRGKAMSMKDAETASTTLANKIITTW